MQILLIAEKYLNFPLIKSNVQMIQWVKYCVLAQWDAKLCQEEIFAQKQ